MFFSGLILYKSFFFEKGYIHAHFFCDFVSDAIQAEPRSIASGLGLYDYFFVFLTKTSCITIMMPVKSNSHAGKSAMLT